MPNGRKKHLIVIAGPTAVGKTALSIQLAKDLQSEIISADSRQFFRELNIGTAKPSKEELAEVPHHFVNSHSITQSYSAGDFERDSLNLLETLFEKDDYVIMTGGSGFYIKAVLEGLDDLPQPPPGLRDSLIKRLETEGLEHLQREISKIDPDFAATKELSNPQRVLRALEVFATNGIPISSYKSRNVRERPFQAILIAIDRNRSALYERIDLRMDLMLEQGLVEEVRSLYPYRAHHALQTVGYKEVYGFLDGLYDDLEMTRLLKQNSRRYAKRQITWFRHQGNFQWFDAGEYHQILNYVKDQLQKD